MNLTNIVEMMKNGDMVVGSKMKTVYRIHDNQLEFTPLPYTKNSIFKKVDFNHIENIIVLVNEDYEKLIVEVSFEEAVKDMILEDDIYKRFARSGWNDTWISVGTKNPRHDNIRYNIKCIDGSIDSHNYTSTPHDILSNNWYRILE